MHMKAVCVRVSLGEHMCIYVTLRVKNNLIRSMHMHMHVYMYMYYSAGKSRYACT